MIDLNEAPNQPLKLPFFKKVEELGKTLTCNTKQKTAR